MKRRLSAWLTAILGGLIVGNGSGCSPAGAEPSAKAPAAPRAVPVTVAPLEHRTVERTVDVVGSLRGWEQVTVGSKRTGRVPRPQAAPRGVVYRRTIARLVSSRVRFSSSECSLEECKVRHCDPASRSTLIARNPTESVARPHSSMAEASFSQSIAAQSASVVF